MQSSQEQQIVMIGYIPTETPLIMDHNIDKFWQWEESEDSCKFLLNNIDLFIILT